MKHGNRKTRASHRVAGLRGRAARAIGDLWDARERIAELEAALRRVSAWNDNPSRYSSDLQKILDGVIDGGAVLTSRVCAEEIARRANEQKS